MKRDAFTLPLDLGNELIIDNFAGGGGTSTGLEAAFGRPVDIAINHDPEALAMHALNHPYTQHLCESVWNVDPIEVTGNRPVGLVWLSPDCKHFSKAKGGTPVSKNIRGLAWVTLRWLLTTSPRAFMIENVEEFVTWGELIEISPGNWMPDPSKKGETFRAFIGMITKGVDAAHPALIEACEMLGIALDSPEAKRLVAGLGYTADWRELRACDNGAPTIRKRLFIVGRRDGLPIVFPTPSHGDPVSREVVSGMLAPYRTAAECIDFDLEAESIFDRKKPLVPNTQRRVAKGLWRHVLANASPFIVGVGGRMGQSPARSVHVPAQTVTAKADSCLAQPILVPFLNEHANASNQRTMPADEPMRTLCAQVKGGHFSVVATQLEPIGSDAILTPFTTGAGGPEYAGKPVAVDQPFGTLTTENHRAVVSPTLIPLRGTSESHLASAHSVEAPLGTVSAGGTHHALAAAHLVTIGYGEREGQEPRTQPIEGPLGTAVAGGVKQALVAAHITKFRTDSTGASMQGPMPTVTANSFVKRPGGSAPLGIVAAHLTHLTHHGDRPGMQPTAPLPTVTGAHRGEQALIGASFLEQANGGFWEDNDGRPVSAPMSTIASKGANQRLVTAYLVKYYSSGGQWQDLSEPLHTNTTKGRMGLVESIQIPIDALDAKHRQKARACAHLLHEHLPEQFPDRADCILMWHGDAWWVLVDITLRMLKARELYRAQAFPDNYIIHEIPDPALLFKNGKQVADPRSVPRIPLSITAQIRMCGNSVSPVQAEALVRANFAHERAFRNVA